MTKAPTLRIVSLIGVALLVLYALGRWDARVSAEFRELRTETSVVLALGKIARRRSDSLRLLERTALAQAAELQQLEDSFERQLEELRSVDSTELEAARNIALEDLLPPLRMQPLQIAHTIAYVADSAGVRFLSGRMLRLSQLERRLPVIDSLATSRGRHVSLLEAAQAATQARADSAENRIVALEGLLEDWQATTSCKILWLIPCPSRGLAFVGGAVATTLVIVVASK